MGNSILFCSGCGRRISDADVAAGVSLSASGEPVCAECSANAAPAAAPDTVAPSQKRRPSQANLIPPAPVRKQSSATMPAVGRRPSDRSIPVANDKRRPSERGIPVAERRKPSDRNIPAAESSAAPVVAAPPNRVLPIVVGVVGGAVVAVVLMLALSGNKEKEPEKPVAEAPPATPTPTVKDPTPATPKTPEKQEKTTPESTPETPPAAPTPDPTTPAIPVKAEVPVEAAPNPTVAPANPTAPAVTPAPVLTPAPETGAQAVVVRPGVWSLLESIEKKDFSSGTWAKDADGSWVSGDRWERINFAVEPPEEYNLRVVFMRKTKKEHLAIYFPVGSKRAAFAIGHSGNKAHAFTPVGSNDIKAGNPTFKESASVFESGQKHTLIMKFRKGNIQVLLNDQLINEWKTEMGAIGNYDKPKTNTAKSLGVGCIGSSYAIYAFELEAVTGKPTFTRGEPVASAAQLTKASLPSRRVLEFILKDEPKKAREFLTGLDESTEPVDKKDAELGAAILRQGDEIRKGVQKGFGLLVDGRAFEIEALDSRTFAVGKDRPAKVLKDDTGIYIETEKGPRKEKEKVVLPVDQLAPGSRFDLLRNTFEGQADEKLRLAIVAVGAAKRGVGVATADEVKAWLDDVDKEEALKPISVAVREQLVGIQGELNALTEKRKKEVAERAAKDKKESDADALWEQIQESISKKKLDDAWAEVKKFEFAFTGTAAFVKNEEKLPALKEKIKQLAIKPGLWISYWTNEKVSFKTKRFVKMVYAGEWLEKIGAFRSSMKNFPKEAKKADFSMRMRGSMVVPETGKYRLQIDSNDQGNVLIDGLKVLGFTKGQKETGDLELKKGLVEFGIDFWPASDKKFDLDIKWAIAPVGPNDKPTYRDFPPGSFWYHTSHIEEYQKP